MSFRQFANSVNPATTLAAGYTSGGASLSVNSVANLPANVEYIIGVVTSGVTEFFLVTAKAGSGPYTLTATGAQEGSSAANHSNGDSVYLVLTAGAISQILLEHNNIGLYANRPTSATGARKGMSYRCTDSPYEYIYDGSAWQPFVFGYNVVEPVLANFTQVAVAQSTFDSTHGGILQTVPGQGASEHTQVLAQAIPGSGAYYVDAAFLYRGVLGAQGTAGSGLSAGLLTSSGLAFQGFGYESGSFQALQKRYSAVATWVSNSGVVSVIPHSPLIWTRVLDDRTTNRTFYWSTDGYTWHQILQEARTTGFTPAEGILAIVPYNQTIGVHWLHFSIHA